MTSSSLKVAIIYNRSRKSTPIIGRITERQELSENLDSTGAGKGRIIGVVGGCSHCKKSPPLFREAASWQGWSVSRWDA